MTATREVGYSLVVQSHYTSCKMCFVAVHLFSYHLWQITLYKIVCYGKVHQIVEACLPMIPCSDQRSRAFHPPREILWACEKMTFANWRYAWLGQEEGPVDQVERQKCLQTPSFASSMVENGWLVGCNQLILWGEGWLLKFIFLMWT